jgi:hypothetical protein
MGKQRDELGSSCPPSPPSSRSRHSRNEGLHRRRRNASSIVASSPSPRTTAARSISVRAGDVTGMPFTVSRSTAWSVRVRWTRTSGWRAARPYGTVTSTGPDGASCMPQSNPAERCETRAPSPAHIAAAKAVCSLEGGTPWRQYTLGSTRFHRSLPVRRLSACRDTPSRRAWSAVSNPWCRVASSRARRSGASSKRGSHSAGLTAQ